MGTIRTVVRKGGGVAFGKKTRDFRQDMPKKQRRLARNSAVLAKLKSDDAVVVDRLQFDGGARVAEQMCPRHQPQPDRQWLARNLFELGRVDKLVDRQPFTETQVYLAA